jgi:amino acid adenylation domain-containing protein
MFGERRGRPHRGTTRGSYVETDFLMKTTYPGEDEAVVLPASYAQQRLWFLDRLEPESAAYHVPVVSRLRGRLDVAALGRALTALGERHESLRTTFTMIDGVPHQLIASRPSVVMTVTDVRAEPDAEAAALALADEDSATRFDLIAGPLWRARLISISDEDHILSLTLHHTIADAWSVGILLRELSSLYGAELDGRPADLPELAIQYGDYAAWQREWMDSGGLDRQLAYWKSHLAGAPALLELLTDHPRPAMQSFNGAKASTILPRGLLDGLRALSEREGTTLFMTLLAAFVALMNRYTHSDDIVVASPVANRNRLELEGLIGVFANTLALRTSVDGDPTFSELLARVRESALAAYSNQDLPFEKLVEELNPPRDLSYAPVTQVMFVLHNHVGAAAQFAGIEREVVTTQRDTAKFDLALFTEARPDGLRASLEYCRDLFDEATVQRMLGHLEMLLGAIVADPSLPVADLPLLTAAERRRLEAWNDTEAPYVSAGMHELFAEQARRRPQATAVQFGDDRLSYAELDARANQLAQELRALGAAPGVLVGLCMERSLELPLAMLGVLKSGAAYVPIDPGYPAERQAFLLEDAQAPVLITQSHLVDELPDHGAAVLRLDGDWPRIALNASDAPAGVCDPEHLAYVIYTSGSTGRPKGVEITHRSVANLIAHMRQAPGLTEDDVVGNLTTPAFDLSVPDWYLPLTTGARLVIVPRESTLDAFALADCLDTIGATFVQATPTTWQMLVDSGWDGSPALKIVCGGEAVPRALANELLERGASLWHMYGPTETTVWSSIRSLEPGQGPTPIGGPIANTSFVVLDRHRRPVPVGVAGELHIAGHGLARGYRNRPELTAERFVLDPRSDERGRLYATGDLVRWRDTGTLEFLGRIDHQVKLRGFRIELGEIEAGLREHERVREAVVVVREMGPGDTRLVAYLTADSPTLDAAELRALLRLKLPEYMIPSAFVTLNAFPLTPNGKVDRSALPMPGDSARAKSEYAPPTNELERSLTEIWERLLGVQRVGIDDDFFELGGHSLLAVQLVHAIEQELGQTCTLVMLFRNGTVRSLAHELHVGGPENRSRAVLQLGAGTGPALFCICGIHAYQELADQLAPEIPVYGIFLPVEQDMFTRGANGHQSEISVEEMAAGYLEAVRAQQPEGPYMLLGFCFGGILAYEVARQLLQAGEEVSSLIMLDSKLRSSIKPRRARTALQRIKRKGTQTSTALSGEVRRRLAWAAGDPGGKLGETERLELIRLQAYRAAMLGYEARRYDGAAVVVRPADTKAKHVTDPTFGWGERVSSLELLDVPGDHISHLKSPNVKALADALRPRFERARQVSQRGEIA